MTQQIQQEPIVDYFPSDMPGLGEYFANTTPIALAAKHIKNSTSMQVNGLGRDDDKFRIDQVSATAWIVGGGFLVLAGALSYQAGKAMAPSNSAKTTWGWVAVPMGLFVPFGMGLGIMGAIANAGK